jgi:radical SAM protein with 4Fe4S-binding SPASM domain
MGTSITTQQTDRIVLNPQLYMRRDVDRIYIFPVNPFTYQEKSKRVYIKSAEAIIIALFDGVKSVDDVSHDIKEILEVDLNTAIRIVAGVIMYYREYLLDVDKIQIDELPKYDPSDYIIPREKIDMSTMYPKIPEVIMFIPTFDCGFTCRYCYAPRNRGQKSIGLSDISLFLQQMAEWQIPSLFFSGGDPFNHSEIWKILQRCTEYGIKPILPTKSIFKIDQLNQLCTLGIDELQISLDANDQRLCHALIGAGSDYVSYMLQQIRYLIRRGIRVYTNTVLTNATIRRVPNFIKQLYSLGVRKMSFSQYSRSLFCHSDTLFCNPRDYDWLEQEMDSLRTQLPSLKVSYNKMRDPSFMNRRQKEQYFTARPNCTAGKMGMVILPDGKITVCETLYYNRDMILGDLRDSSIEDIWNAEKRRMIIANSPECLSTDVCTSCPEVEYCYTIKGKCYVRALQAFNDVKMPDPYCPKSPKGLRIL